MNFNETYHRHCQHRLVKIYQISSLSEVQYRNQNCNFVRLIVVSFLEQLVVFTSDLDYHLNPYNIWLV